MGYLTCIHIFPTIITRPWPTSDIEQMYFVFSQYNKLLILGHRPFHSLAAADACYETDMSSFLSFLFPNDGVSLNLTSSEGRSSSQPSLFLHTYYGKRDC